MKMVRRKTALFQTTRRRENGNTFLIAYKSVHGNSDNEAVERDQRILR